VTPAGISDVTLILAAREITPRRNGFSYGGGPGQIYTGENYEWHRVRELEQKCNLEIIMCNTGSSTKC